MARVLIKLFLQQKRVYQHHAIKKLEHHWNNVYDEQLSMVKRSEQVKLTFNSMKTKAMILSASQRHRPQN